MYLFLQQRTANHGVRVIPSSANIPDDHEGCKMLGTGLCSILCLGDFSKLETALWGRNDFRGNEAQLGKVKFRKKDAG